jgi:hypothetical protein
LIDLCVEVHLLQRGKDVSMSVGAALLWGSIVEADVGRVEAH